MSSLYHITDKSKFKEYCLNSTIEELIDEMWYLKLDYEKEIEELK